MAETTLTVRLLRDVRLRDRPDEPIRPVKRGTKVSLPQSIARELVVGNKAALLNAGDDQGRDRDADAAAASSKRSR